MGKSRGGLTTKGARIAKEAKRGIDKVQTEAERIKADAIKLANATTNNIKELRSKGEGKLMEATNKTLTFLKDRLSNLFKTGTSRKTILAATAITVIGVGNPYLVAGLAGLAMLLNTYEKSKYIQKDTTKLALENTELSLKEVKTLESLSAKLK